MTVTAQNQWVIFKLAGEVYGLPVTSVKEMTRLNRINQIPNLPNFILGTMLLRDRVVPIIDLRLRLGLPSLEEEKSSIIQLLREREEDHVRWLAELEASIREKRPFNLARDPRQCAFGRWYDRFRTQDLVLAGELKKFEQPHQAVHAVADEALELENHGRTEAAQELISGTRNTVLAEMIRLFEQTRRVIAERTFQIAVMVEDRDRLVGLTVDEILSVIRIEPDRFKTPPVLAAGGGEQYLLGLAEPQNQGQGLIILLDSRKLTAGAGPPPADRT